MVSSLSRSLARSLSLSLARARSLSTHRCLRTHTLMFAQQCARPAQPAMEFRIQDDNAELKVLLMGVGNGANISEPSALADASVAKPSLGSSDFLIASGRVHMKTIMLNAANARSPAAAAAEPLATSPFSLFLAGGVAENVAGAGVGGVGEGSEAAGIVYPATPAEVVYHAPPETLLPPVSASAGVRSGVEGQKGGVLHSQEIARLSRPDSSGGQGRGGFGRPPRSPRASVREGHKMKASNLSQGNAPPVRHVTFNNLQVPPGPSTSQKALPPPWAPTSEHNALPTLQPRSSASSQDPGKDSFCEITEVDTTSLKGNLGTEEAARSHPPSSRVKGREGETSDAVSDQSALSSDDSGLDEEEETCCCCLPIETSVKPKSSGEGEMQKKKFGTNTGSLRDAESRTRDLEAGEGRETQKEEEVGEEVVRMVRLASLGKVSVRVLTLSIILATAMLLILLAIVLGSNGALSPVLIYTNTSVCLCVHACVRARACMHARIFVCVWSCVCVCVHVCVCVLLNTHAAHVYVRALKLEKQTLWY